jgi:hypothetical protein
MGLARCWKVCESTQERVARERERERERENWGRSEITAHKHCT